MVGVGMDLTDDAQAIGERRELMAMRKRQLLFDAAKEGTLFDVHTAGEVEIRQAKRERLLTEEV